MNQLWILHFSKKKIGNLIDQINIKYWEEKCIKSIEWVWENGGRLYDEDGADGWGGGEGCCGQLCGNGVDE